MKRISPFGSMAYIEVSSDPDALFPALSKGAMVILTVLYRHPLTLESMHFV